MVKNIENFDYFTQFVCFSLKKSGIRVIFVMNMEKYAHFCGKHRISVEAERKEEHADEGFQSLEK